MLSPHRDRPQCRPRQYRVTAGQRCPSYRRAIFEDKVLTRSYVVDFKTAVNPRWWVTSPGSAEGAVLNNGRPYLGFLTGVRGVFQPLRVLERIVTHEDIASKSRAMSPGATCCGQDWRRLRSGAAMPCSCCHSAG